MKSFFINALLNFSFFLGLEIFVENFSDLVFLISISDELEEEELSSFNPY